MLPTSRLSRQLPHKVAAHGLVTYRIHRSDPASSTATLANGDVVKIHLGAHIDGYPAIAAETLIVGATAESPATGPRADVIKAAWTAAEAAMRVIKVGEKNWSVTEIVSKAAEQFGCVPVEGDYLNDHFHETDA